MSLLYVTLRPLKSYHTKKSRRFVALQLRENEKNKQTDGHTSVLIPSAGSRCFDNEHVHASVARALPTLILNENCNFGKTMYSLLQTSEGYHINTSHLLRARRRKRDHFDFDIVNIDSQLHERSRASGNVPVFKVSMRSEPAPALGAGDPRAWKRPLDFTTPVV
ncbi:hypothetical protein EVAR_102132_1 [Eumeta japonica]|uniref:Uncharacterized protein n=1 Tax=Eumeta variegata TaxID=151549 RepID=A0A4C1U0K3_EUMVA|nr:hypothetical protein EVAR_102132_1 [Eumeta japonica]